MKWLYTIFFVLLTSLSARGQVLPAEKVYFSADRSQYEFPDSIIIEGRLMRVDSDTTMAPYSDYVYVELFDSSDSLKVRQKLVVDRKGEFMTRIHVGMDWPDGVYYLRSFSKVMANFAEETLPIFPVEIGRPRRVLEPESDLFCYFYPEGGRLVDGAPQNLGVLFKDQNGQPVQLKYALIRHPHDTLAVQTSTSRGWQVLQVNPQKGESYFLSASFRGKPYTLLLPERENRPVLQSYINRRQLHLKVLNPDRSISRGQIYIYHQQLGLLKLNYRKKDFVMYLNRAPEGLVTVMLADNDGNIISQNSHWYETRGLKASLSSRSLSRSTEIPIEWSSPLDSTASVFVRFIPKKAREEFPFLPGVESMLKYESDLNSAEYFPLRGTPPSDSRKEIAGWLYSSQFKRINVPEAVNIGLTYVKDKEKAMHLDGKATTKSGKALSNGSVLAYRKSDGQVYNLEMDARGEFSMPVDNFGEDEQFFIEAFDRKGRSGYYNYDFLNDSLPPIRNWNRIERSQNPGYEVFINGQMGSFGLNRINKLPEVVVKGKVERRDPQAEKKFYGARYLTEEAMKERHFVDFAHMIRYFHSHLQLVELQRDESMDDPGRSGQGGRSDLVEGYVLVSSRGRSVLDPKKAEVKILLDGSPITTEFAMNMDMDIIGTAEYLTPAEALAYTPNAISGALMLTTRNYRPEEVRSKGVVYTPPMGLSNLDVARRNRLITPSQPGEYHMLVDVISEQLGFHSYDFQVEVVQ